MIDTEAVRTLNRDGVLMCSQLGGTSVSDFDGYAELMKQAGEFADSDYVANETRAALSGQSRAGLKDWLVRRPCQSKEEPLARFATSRNLTDTVASVIGPTIALLKAEFWYVVPWAGKGKQWSQSWHRDPESEHIIKVFLYCREVSNQAGPFEYVRGSHADLFDLCPAGKYLEPSKYDQLDPVRPRTFPGPAGTLVLANTAGLHRGGYGTEPRVTAVMTYLRKVAA